MPYFSHLLKSKVKDSAEFVIGKLSDMVVMPKIGEYAPLEFIQVRLKKNGHTAYIPYEYVENLGSRAISLKNTFKSIPAQPEVGEEAIHLKKNILDQQIVDLAGARVVRVNDLRLGNFEGKMCALGIDVSFKGLLRRVGLDDLDIFNVLKVNLIDWRQTQPVQGFLRLNIVSANLSKLHPADLANIIEDLSVGQGSHLVTALDSQRAARVFEEINPQVQKILVKHLGAERVTEILKSMSSDEMTDLISLLPKNEADIVLRHLKNSAAEKVGKLLRYPGESAGGLMTLDYLTARPDWTVKETIEEIKKASPSMRSILYLYVTDKENVFLGAISLRTLLVAEPDKKLKTLLKQISPLSTLTPYQSIDEIVKIMTKYNLYMAAVLDRNRKLLGVVAIDDIMSQLAPNA